MRNTLDESALRKYLDNDACECPFCGSGNIEGGPVEIDLGSAWQKVSCVDCEKEWSDLYTLTGVCSALA